MKKLVYFILSIFIILISPFSTFASSASTTVLPDKVWAVTFSKSLESNSAKQNISVRKFNEQMNQWDIFEIQPIVENNKVLINHELPYEDGKYELKISKNIRSVKSKNMSEDINFSFTVQTELIWPIEFIDRPWIIGRGEVVKVFIDPKLTNEISSVTVMGVEATLMSYDIGLWRAENVGNNIKLEDLQGNIVITYK